MPKSNPPDRMHSVAAGYLRAFADPSPEHRSPRVWRFESGDAYPKPIGVLDASVQRGLYALRDEAGKVDTTIETQLFQIDEESLPEVIRLLESGDRPSYEQWQGLIRYMAFQLVRTPRMFQIYKNEVGRRGIELGRHDLPLAPIFQGPILHEWLCAMTWTLSGNHSALPLLTSDNPVARWVEKEDTLDFLAGFAEPGLHILFPLNPRMCLLGIHNDASLKAVRDHEFQTQPRFSDPDPPPVFRGALNKSQATELNRVTILHSERYTYASSDQEEVRLLVQETHTRFRRLPTLP
jgi:hypothetical protein